MSACVVRSGDTLSRETLTNDQLIREEYQGIRPAPGYPACPDHTEKAKLWELLDAEKKAGIKLTESFAMYPTAAVSGWYFSHPEARYFNIGKIDRDQVEDYARRKGMSLEDMERWLSPNLGYEPGVGRRGLMSERQPVASSAITTRPVRASTRTVRPTVERPLIKSPEGDVAADVHREALHVERALVAARPERRASARADETSPRCSSGSLVNVHLPSSRRAHRRRV